MIPNFAADLDRLKEKLKTEDEFILRQLALLRLYIKLFKIYKFISFGTALVFGVGGTYECMFGLKQLSIFLYTLSVVFVVIGFGGTLIYNKRIRKHLKALAKEIAEANRVILT